MIHIGIDAFNIKSGGGLTHLSQFLKAIEPEKYSIEKVTVWTSYETAEILPKFKWLQIKSPFWISKGLLIRFFMHHFLMANEIERAGCDVLFVPGGIAASGIKIPKILMSQNMLPFEPNEAKLFGNFSFMRLKFFLLRIFQKYNFQSSDGLIFLTNYAKNKVLKHLNSVPKSIVVIPHGIEQRFFVASKPINDNPPLKFLYVSALLPYKHQIEIADAFLKIFSLKKNIEIIFIGSCDGFYGRKFIHHINKVDPNCECIKYIGEINFKDLHEWYQKSDIFIFASTCENLPNILIEAMAAGLPVASSSFGPMTEVLGEDSVYFNPFDQNSIELAINKFLNNRSLREKLSSRMVSRAKKYSWKICARDTISFLVKVANKYP